MHIVKCVQKMSCLCGQLAAPAATRNPAGQKNPAATQGCRVSLLEAPPGFEPGHRGFADPCLTTWLWCPIWWLEIRNWEFVSALTISSGSRPCSLSLSVPIPQFPATIQYTQIPTFCQSLCHLIPVGVSSRRMPRAASSSRILSAVAKFFSPRACWRRSINC